MPALVAELASDAPDQPTLQLAVADVGMGTFRVVMHEVNPFRDRYIARDALEKGIGPRSLEEAILFIDTDHAHLMLKDAPAKVRVWFKPFRVELIRRSDEAVLAQLNAEDRLQIEPLREKPTPTPTPEPASEQTSTESPIASPFPQGEKITATPEGYHEDGDDDHYDYEHHEGDEAETAQKTERAEPAKREDCSGCWEEKFQSHTDPKLRGPESVGADILFPLAEHVYGIPERTVRFSLTETIDVDGNTKSEPYRMYNLDVFEFELDKPLGLYGAIPFITARRGADAIGMLWLNSAETYVDVRASKDDTGKSTHWFSESGMIDVYLLPGPTSKDVFQQYLRLTGAPAMPQRFALGYHQCRWNYRDEADSKAIDAEFDKRDIPYDVLWLDIEHTDGKRYFTWDYSRFPDPTGLQNHIAARGRKMVTIIDPHIKRDDKYPLHRLAMDEKYYVMKPDGKPFDGWCWPGSSSYFDFTCPSVRKAWAGRFNPKDYPHFTEHLYTWNDMNEPSVFNGPEGTMQKDLLHDGSVEHRHVHNIYGHYFMQATFEGLLKGHGGNDRPFVLSRSFFAGSQRYGAIWTGDNSASWDHLESSVRMLLPLQISGMVFSGADVGGFFGNPSPELLTRWYQAGAFQPFFRGHAHLDTNRREPWLFGEPYTAFISKAIRTRYEYIPLWYTLFAGNSLGSKGEFSDSSHGPPMRPLWWEFPEDGHADVNERQWMVGNALLAAPVFEEGASNHSIYVPKGDKWYDLYDPEAFGRPLSGTGNVEIQCGLDRLVVLQRGGTIVPKQERRRRSTAAMARDPYTLVVALDVKGEAEGELYMDDGRSFDHERGHYVLRRFKFRDNTLSVRTVGGGEKQFNGSDALVERVVILGYGSEPASFASVDGREVSLAHAQPTGVLTIQRIQAKVAEGDWTLKVLP